MTSKIIGYSGFDNSEECYEYFENSCYIADTPQSAENLMKDSLMCMGDYRIDPIRIDQIMNDFGASCGDYAMEKKAFERFKAVAEKMAIQFNVNEEESDSSLILVVVEGVQISDD